MIRKTRSISRVAEPGYSSDTLYHSLYTQSTDGIYVTTPEGRYLDVNPRGCKMFGYTRREILGMKISELITEDESQRNPLRLVELKAGKKILTERRLRRKDGTLLPVEIKARRLSDGNLLGIVSDISDRTHAENELRESRERYRSLFENMLNGFAYCRMLFEQGLPRDFVYLEVNCAFEKLTGLKDVIGKKVTEVIPGIRESNPELFEIYGRVALTGRPEIFETYLDTLRIWLSISVYSPRKEHFVAVFDNITERKRAEDELREEKERFRLAAENLSDVVYEWDIGNRVQWFGNIDELLGYAPGEFPHTLEAWADILHPEDRDRVWSAVEKHLQGEAAYDIEYRVRRKDGAWRYWMARGTVLRDSSGKPCRWIGAVTDTTEQRQVEEDLRQSRERERFLADIIESTDQPFGVGYPDGRLGFCNRAFCELTGYSADEVQSIDWSTVLTPPEWRDVEMKSLAELERTGRPVRYQKEYIRKDGRRIAVELLAHLVRDDSGKVRHYYTFVTDITERKRSETALRDNQRLLQMVIDLVPHFVFAKDRESRHLFVNRACAEANGMTPEQMVGLCDLDFVPDPAQAEAFMRDDRQVIAGGAPKLIPEETLTDAAGRTRILQTMKIPFSVPGTGEPALMGVAVDITELKRAEEAVRRLNAELEDRVVQRTAQLEAANQELEAFAYSISHDLRAPLRAINGFSGILVEEFAPELSTEAQRYLGIVQKSARQMGCLIDDLLSYSRLIRQPLIRRTVDIADLARHVLEDLREQKSNRCVETVVADLPPCQADPVLLRKVLVNLLSNALKFTRKRETARIEVGYQGRNSECVYFVRDNGVGFDMQYAHKLFGVFQRLHDSSEYEGTGVGLAIAQRIIHRHGGRVWAEAQVDRGAVFYFTLQGGQI